MKILGYALYCGHSGPVLYEETQAEAEALAEHDDDTVCALVPVADLDVEAAVERAVLALDMEAFERAGFDAATLGRACALAALDVTP